MLSEHHYTLLKWAPISDSETYHGSRKLSILPEEDHEDVHCEPLHSTLPVPSPPFLGGVSTPFQPRPLPPPYRPPPAPLVTIPSLSYSTPHLTRPTGMCHGITSSYHRNFDTGKSKPLLRAFSVPHTGILGR